jgi:hypothetical protein
MTLIAYGPAINDAIKNAKTKLADLVALRDHASSIVKAQGNLKASMKKLDQEIKRRQKAEGGKKKKKK